MASPEIFSAGTSSDPRIAEDRASVLDRKLTYEDYLLFPEDGNRHEILDGEHYVTAAPYPRHQSIVVQLTWWIESHLRQHRLGRLYVAPIDVLLGRHDIVQPDLLFISNASLKILTEKNVQGAPDLVVEVLSDSTRKRDEGIKLERYELLGVQEYWVVDPKRSEARIYCGGSARRLGRKCQTVRKMMTPGGGRPAALAPTDAQDGVSAAWRSASG